MKHIRFSWQSATNAALAIFLIAGCSREPVPQYTQGHDFATNEVKTIEAEMLPGDAAYCVITNYPVAYKKIIREVTFNKLCRRILIETTKDESARMYALLADAAIRQPVSHEPLERRCVQVEGLWEYIFSAAFSFGQKGLVLEHDNSFEYWERLLKFLERVKDEIEDMKTILDDGRSRKSSRKRACVHTMASCFRRKIIRDARCFLGNDCGYADLLTDEQRSNILQRLSQYEKYAMNVEAEIKGMIRIQRVDETGGQEEALRSGFDSDAAGDGIGF